MYRVDKEVDIDIQLKKQVIKPPTINSEGKGVTQNKPKLVQNMTSSPDKHIPKQSQVIAQLKIVLKISLLERSRTQDKLITIPHARFRKVLKLKPMYREGIKNISKEIPPYTESTLQTTS